jgi:DNA polymerase I
MPENRILLIDSLALIYNAFRNYGHEQMHSSDGTNTAITNGFFQEIDEIISVLKPTHLAFAFDIKKPTFRHHLFKQYKAHRQSMPDEIAQSIPIIKKILNLLKFQTFELEGFEADDIIGTIATKASEQNFNVLIITLDKDFNQLISDNISIYKPRKTGKGARLISKNEVCDKYKISEPAQFVHLMALVGDTSDNIPGIKKLSIKQAQKLINQFGSIENIYNHLNTLNLKYKEIFLKHKETIELSKKLLTIDTDTPITVDFDNLVIQEFNLNALKEYLIELNLGSLLNLKFIKLRP